MINMILKIIISKYEINWNGKALKTPFLKIFETAMK